MRNRKRNIANNSYYHITNRGVAKRTTFLDEEDYKIFLTLMRKGCLKYEVRLIAFCLMPNHFHLLACCSEGKDLSLCLQWITSIYAKYFNRRYGRRGHLWQDRFYAKRIKDGFHLGVCWRYVEQNPVRANLIGKTYEWKWSSAYCRRFGHNSRYLIEPHWWNTSIMSKWWSDDLLDEELLNKIRRSIRKSNLYDEDEEELWE
ncbi:MAG: transposase [Phycisphaerales bacterium]|nr:transposase [Phycisphaerales bacterium]